MAKGKKGKGKKSKEDGASDNEHENTREYFVNLLNSTEEKLTNTKERLKGLQDTNKQHKNENERRSKDQQDLLEYYTRETNADFTEIGNLQQTLDLKKQQLIAGKQQHLGKLEFLEKDMQNKKEDYETANDALDSQIATMSDYERKRNDLLRMQRELDRSIIMIQEQNSTDLYHIEKEAVKEKDKLKKEMFQKVNEVTNEFRLVSNQQMAETTKKTISMNLGINAKLVNVTERVRKVMTENENLTEKLKLQTRTLDILSNNDDTLDRKNDHCNRLIHLLTERSTEMDTDLCVTEEILDETEEKITEMQVVKNEWDIKNEEYNKLREKLVLEQKVVNLTNQIDDSKKEKERIQELIDRVLIDLAHFKNGLSDNILSCLLRDLCSCISTEKREEVERILNSGPVMKKKVEVGIVRQN